MNKFKVGDRVLRISGGCFSNGSNINTISVVEDDRYWFKECGNWLGIASTDKHYILAATPHKHAALIHAWADGAVIECIVMRGTNTVWIRCDTPTWTGNVSGYRIKPEKSEAELERDAIMKEMEALKVRLSKLEV